LGGPVPAGICGPRLQITAPIETLGTAAHGYVTKVSTQPSPLGRCSNWTARLGVMLCPAGVLGIPRPVTPLGNSNNTLTLLAPHANIPVIRACECFVKTGRSKGRSRPSNNNNVGNYVGGPIKGHCKDSGLSISAGSALTTHPTSSREKRPQTNPPQLLVPKYMGTLHWDVARFETAYTVTRIVGGWHTLLIEPALDRRPRSA